jgi:hypothetical protein
VLPAHRRDLHPMTCTHPDYYLGDCVKCGHRYTLDDDLVYRLRKRAEIRRQIPNRKSVQEGKTDRIADLLEEAANEIERLRASTA